MRLLTRARHSAPRVCTSVLFIYRIGELGQVVPEAGVELGGAAGEEVLAALSAAWTRASMEAIIVVMDCAIAVFTDWSSID